MHRRQLWIAVALILVESGVFAVFSDAWTVPIIAAILGLVAFTTEWRIVLQPQRRFMAAMALAIPFTVQWAFAPYEPAHLRTFILYSLAHAGGQYGLALQVAYIWTKSERDTWSAWFPLCGVCVLMAAGDVQTNHFQNVIFQGFVLAFVLLTSVYFSWARIPLTARPWQRISGRFLLSVSAVGLTCGTSIVGSQMLERSWSTIERIYTEWMLGSGQQGAVGFSRQAKLGSISDRASALDHVPVLRLYAKTEPGYLRGAAFDRYRGGNWLNDAPRISVRSDEHAPAVLKEMTDVPLFRLATSVSNHAADKGTRATQPWEILDVWPSGTLGDAIFAPLEAHWLAVPQENLTLDRYGIAYPEALPAQANYQCVISATSTGMETDVEPLTASNNPARADLEHQSLSLNLGSELPTLTAVPEDLDPRVRDLAQAILKDCVTAEQKVVAVRGWFRKNYHYELGMRVPAGQDPLTHFLIRRPPAHCEYFATGSAILLRLGGVPCRYVTGFVSTEYNYVGGYWLARNKDAHAWVEALLPDQGWIVVESTPAAGIPHSEHSIQPRHLWDDLVLRVQMLRSQLTQGSWRGLWRAVKVVLSMLFTTPHGWLMLCGLVIWMVVLFRRHFHFTFGRRPDSMTAKYYRMLHQLDRQLDRLTQQREPHETLHQFAIRLDASADPLLQLAANWYRDYSYARYQGLAGTEDFEGLLRSLEPIVLQLKQRKRN